MANYYTNTSQKALENAKDPSYKAKSALKKPFSGLFGAKKDTSGLYGENKEGKYNYAAPTQQATAQPKPATAQPQASYAPAQAAKPAAPSQYTPASYASGQQGIIDRIRSATDEYAPRIASPFKQFGIGDMQKRASDYDLARYNAELSGLGKAGELNQGLLTSSLPQAVAPGSSLIQPIAGGQVPGYSPTESALRGGQISAIGDLGSQSVEIGSQFNQLANLKNLLGGVDANNPTSINVLNQKINQLRSNVSSPEAAQFRTYLSSIAGLIEDKALAKDISDIASGNLANANPDTIYKAIQAVQNSLQAKQSGIYSTVGNGAPSSGGVVNTSIGPVPTDW